MARLGGSWRIGALCGWYLGLDGTSSNRYRALGGRLLYVPKLTYIRNVLKVIDFDWKGEVYYSMGKNER